VKIIQTTKFVVDNSTFVSIDENRIAEFARAFEHGSTRHWRSAAPFDFSDFTDDQKLSFLFIFDAISFCYWGDPKWTITHKGKDYDGGWAMIIALGRAVRDGVPIFDSAFIAEISREDFSGILKGNVQIPLFEERLRIIREAGSVAQRLPFGSIVESANGDGVALLEIILKTFPSFRDESEYQRRTVYFEKRAQLLVSDIYNFFDGKGYGNLRRVDELTTCADYKLPQILRKLGILNYVPELAAKVDAKIEIAHGSPEEVEIRASTIQAVELIKNEAREHDLTITSAGINDHLWLATQEKFPDDKPYHRTRTVAY
jgi:hypothetical protein